MDRATNNRMVLLLIAGIPVTVILASTWLWWFVVRGDLDLVGMLGTANRGDLVQPPRQLEQASLYDSDGRVFELRDAEPRWALLVPAADGVCDRPCEHSLYLTRQIHMAMGKEFNRIQRYYVGDRPVSETALPVDALSDDRPAPPDFAQFLATEHRGLKALSIDVATFEQLFPERAEDPSTWYLVDPAGWVMMSYTEEVPYKDVIADLKFLLKNSSQ
jgi:hypothetical protein